MISALKTMLQETLKLLWLCGKYLGICALLMLGLLSFATGKFPPPITEVYENLRSFQSIMNIGKATRSLASAKEQQNQILSALEDQNLPMPEPGAQTAEQAPQQDVKPGLGINVVSDKERIKALEYEVALLKAKLARAESEASKVQVQQASASQ
jgi:hypothetical protein